MTMKRTARKDREPAARLPIARVCVDVPLPHLDRPFDYQVSVADDEIAQPGTRVKVRFAGQLVNGFLLERTATTEHQGKLMWVEKVVSAEQVLDPEVARLARAVADRYAGNLCDILRLAVPPRHARVESENRAVAGSSPHELAEDSAEPDGPADESDAEEPDPREIPDDEASPDDDPEVVAVDEAGSVIGSGAGSMDEPVRGVEGASGSAAALAGGGSSGDELSVAGVSTEAPPPNEMSPEDSSASLAGVTSSLPVDGAEPASGAKSVGGSSASEHVDPAVVDSAERALGGDAWGAYQAGPAFLRALEDGRSPRAVWAGLPGEDWAARIAEAAAATVRSGRGVVIVVADARDLERVDRALGEALGAGRHVSLNAALGQAERYRRFLAASRHQVAVVAGTRAAMWAPVAKLGLVIIWDDGDDVLAEPRSPYPHAREVLLTRSALTGAGCLVGGFARTGESQLLLETGWAREIVASRDVLRRRSPNIAPTGDDPQLARDPGAATARLPSLAWQAARQALQANAPVLVQVPRRGYLPSVACAECRTPARCPHCSGPLSLAGARDVPLCRWCGRTSPAYSCPACGERRLRASVTGARRTAEELGRAFPGVPVRTSGRDEILEVVPGRASVVVATPGAEPRAEGGFGTVLLLDTWALLTRSDLRAAEETMRRWLNASALARPAREGGRVIVVADGSLAPVQALLRWDPAWFAARELAERRELGFPPAARMVSLTGRPEAVAELLAAARLPDGAELLGPVPAADDQERMLVRVTRSKAADLAHALHEGAAVRSARKAALTVRIEVDPAELL